LRNWAIAHELLDEDYLSYDLVAYYAWAIHQDWIGTDERRRKLDARSVWQAFNKQEVKYRWIRWHSIIKKIYEANGMTLPPCRPPLECERDGDFLDQTPILKFGRVVNYHPVGFAAGRPSFEFSGQSSPAGAVPLTASGGETPSTPAKPLNFEKYPHLFNSGEQPVQQAEQPTGWKEEILDQAKAVSSPKVRKAAGKAAVDEIVKKSKGKVTTAAKLAKPVRKVPAKPVNPVKRPVVSGKKVS